MPGYTKILPPSIVVAGRHGCPFLWRSGRPTRAYNIAALGRVLAPWRPASPRSVPTDRRSSPKGVDLLILMDPYGLTALGLSDLNFLCTNCGFPYCGLTVKGPIGIIGFLFGTFQVRTRKSPFFVSGVLTPYNGRRSDRLPMTQLKVSSSRPWASRLKTKPCWFLWGQRGVSQNSKKAEPSRKKMFMGIWLDWFNGFRDVPLQTLTFNMMNAKNEFQPRLNLYLPNHDLRVQVDPISWGMCDDISNIILKSNLGLSSSCPLL